jgi:hypothetical protein
MATFVPIHGAGDTGWYWHMLEAELRGRGHDVVAPDLPSEDDSAGLPEFADTVVDAIGDRADLVVVAQSFGGFTAPLVCDRLSVDLLVLVAGMVPRPGDWWADTGYQQARREHDERAGGPPADDIALFLHDRPTGPGRRGATAGAEPVRHPRGATLAPGFVAEGAHQVPGLPRRPLLPRRLPPPVVRDRLGITADEIDGSHCVALSHPKDLADRLEAYRAEFQGTAGQEPTEAT